jgi:RND family efflux transporter MFP subunit
MREIFKRHKYIYIGIIIVLIVGGYYWYSKSKTSTTAVQYKTAEVEKGTLIVAVSGSGNVIVDSSANIDPTITGTVRNLAVSVGDKVAKGQFLFEIENDNLAPNVTKAYSSYLQSLASLETAKANKKDAKENYEDASFSEKSLMKKKLEAAEISVTVAEENIKYALVNYQNEKKNYSDSKVVSPIDGTVNEINIKNGDDLSKLSSGSSREVPIIIGDLETMKAQVEVSEVDIASVKVGQKASLTFNAIDNFFATGAVEKIDALGTLTSGVVTYNVTITFDSLDERIRPEMNVSASIVTYSKENVVIVPNNAVKTENGNYYVEVIKNNIVEKKSVEIGSENNSKTEIVKGISQGETVVTQTINSTSKASTSSSSSSSSSSSKNNGRGHGMIPGM